jgi:predicted acyl esterase
MRRTAKDCSSSITLQESMEITGPAAAKLWLSSETADADVFPRCCACSRPTETR